MNEEIKKIEEDNEKRKQDFIKRQEKETEQEVKVMELSAQKLLTRIMDKNSLYDEEQLKNDLIAIVKKISAKTIVEGILEHMQCPMLVKKDWPYCTGCTKGQEIWCHSIKFLLCPAFNHYVTHELIEGPRRQARKEKVPKKKG